METPSIFSSLYIFRECDFSIELVQLKLPLDCDTKPYALSQIFKDLSGQNAGEVSVTSYFVMVEQLDKNKFKG